MLAFALLLTTVYVVLGVLVVLTMRVSEAAFRRMPTWGLLLVYLGAAGLLVFTLWVGNVIAYVASAVIAMGLAVYVVVVVLPKAVPLVGDVLRDAFTRAGRHH